jgi:hypothetical protein
MPKRDEMPNWSDLAAVFSPDSPVKRAESSVPASVEEPRSADAAVEAARAPTEVRPPVDGDVATPVETVATGGDYAEVGADVARILRAAHDAAEEMKRVARGDLEVRIAAVDAELVRRQHELVEREQSFEHRMWVAEEAAAAAARAADDAARVAEEARADAEERLSTLVSAQDSLRARLRAVSDSFGKTLASLSTGDD